MLKWGGRAWTVLSNRFKEFGVPVLWIRGKEYEKNKNVLQTPFFLKGYSHDNWMAFILERVHVISTGFPCHLLHDTKWTFYFRTSHSGFQCEWMFSMLLAPFCFMLSSLHGLSEIFRFIKQLSSSATSFTMSNGEQRVSRICFVFKKAA